MQLHQNRQGERQCTVQYLLSGRKAGTCIVEVTIQHMFPRPGIKSCAGFTDTHLTVSLSLSLCHCVTVSLCHCATASLQVMCPGAGSAFPGSRDSPYLFCNGVVDCKDGKRWDPALCRRFNCSTISTDMVSH